MKNQNEFDFTFTPEELKAVDAAFETLDQFSARFPNKDKNKFVKPPENAGDWVKRMLTMAAQNLSKMARDFDPSKTQRDLDAREALAARRPRLERIMAAWDNGAFFASSDAFSAGLGIRNQLADSGVAGVDDNLDEGLQRFFSRTSSKPAEPPAK